MKIDWGSVKKILVVRLRSIGDTVVATPALQKLREFLPDAKIDIVLEDWVAPVFDGDELLDNILILPKELTGRLSLARRLSKEKYDIAFNFHGGTTAGFLVRASGSRHRIGYKGFQFGFLYTHLFPPASEFFNREDLHSAEHQAALLGFTGVPVDPCPKTNLSVSLRSEESAKQKLEHMFEGRIPAEYALIHPGAAYDTKRWAPEKFTQIVDYLAQKSIASVVVSTGSELPLANEIQNNAVAKVGIISDASLPEIKALAKNARVFVGNDSGIAHIAAAVNSPTVVVFGSSNISHWRPWTNAPNATVSVPFDCRPCPGDKCRVFGQPRCINEVTVEQVIGKLNEVLAEGRI